MVKKVKKDSPPEVNDTAEKTVVEQQELKKQEDLGSKLQVKEKEAAENYDKYLRAVADMENIKKRAAREKAEAIKYGNENLIKDLLPMIDSMDRALRHADNSDDFEAFKKGLKMVQDQLSGCLEKHGVEKIECLDRTFDPNFHEALYHIESSDHENNQIIDELEKGYMLNGRLLRPAKVSVCKCARHQECEQNRED